MNTTPTDLDITATTPAGNSYRLAIYVDPFPGRKGAEVLTDTCGRCGGQGVIHYGNVTLRVGKVSGRVCFMCMGRGVTTRKVSSARSTARRQVQAENIRRAAAADFAATAEDRHAAELLEAHTEALAEQARRDALVQGFVAEEGVRLRNRAATVVAHYTFDSEGYYGQPELKAVIVLTDTETGKQVKTVTTPRGLEVGQEVTYSGTVKAHGSYKGQDQTVLTRAAFK